MKKHSYPGYSSNIAAIPRQAPSITISKMIINSRENFESSFGSLMDWFASSDDSLKYFEILSLSSTDNFINPPLAVYILQSMYKKVNDMEKFYI